VKNRIRSVYGRDSVVVHPPVDTSLFAASQVGGGAYESAEPYHLIVSRLVAYRRLDVAVEAFNRLGRRLVIAGEGPDRRRLEAMAAPNVTLLGRVPTRELAALFAGCCAYVLPGEEDFGIAPVQAQAAGRPVIAFAAGGALDTVVDGVTGVLYRGAGAEALADTVRRFDPNQVDPDACRENAARFSTDLFRKRIREFISGTAMPRAAPTP
jgi:glycosyltransferase involved in cell wall biosynthesis